MTPSTPMPDTMKGREKDSMLKPCPFCSGPAEAYFITGEMYHHRCGCKSCNVYVNKRASNALGSRDTKAEDDARQAWNVRASDTVLLLFVETMLLCADSIVNGKPTRWSDERLQAAYQLAKETYTALSRAESTQ